jgi:hypothetical protein
MLVQSKDILGQYDFTIIEIDLAWLKVEGLEVLLLPVFQLLE